MHRLWQPGELDSFNIKWLLRDDVPNDSQCAESTGAAATRTLIITHKHSDVTSAASRAPYIESGDEAELRLLRS